jgi:hypothetical protein
MNHLHMVKFGRNIIKYVQTFVKSDCYLKGLCNIRAGIESGECAQSAHWNPLAQTQLKALLNYKFLKTVVKYFTFL